MEAVKVDHKPTTFAYKISNKINKKSLTYTADMRPNENILKLSKDSDILICESTFPDEWKEFAHNYYHCTPSDAGEIAQEANAKQLILTHISAVFHEENKLREFKKEAENKFKNKVLIAKDLMVLEF